MLYLSAKLLHKLADEILHYYYFENSHWAGADAECLLETAVEIGIIMQKIVTDKDVKKWQRCKTSILPFQDARQFEEGAHYYVVCSQEEIEEMLKEKTG